MIYVYVWDEYGRVNKSLVVMSKLVRVATKGYQVDNKENTSVNSKYYVVKNNWQDLHPTIGTSNTPNNDNGDIKHKGIANG